MLEYSLLTRTLCAKAWRDGHGARGKLLPYVITFLGEGMDAIILDMHVREPAASADTLV